MLSVPKDKIAVLRYRYVPNTGYVLDTGYSENAPQELMDRVLKVISIRPRELHISSFSSWVHCFTDDKYKYLGHERHGNSTVFFVEVREG